VLAIKVYIVEAFLNFRSFLSTAVSCHLKHSCFYYKVFRHPHLLVLATPFPSWQNEGPEPASLPSPERRGKQAKQLTMVSLNEERRRRRGPFGLANYSKKCIQIEAQLHTVITAMNKARRRSTAQTTKLLSPLPD
jgi:hypothetical protein